MTDFKRIIPVLRIFDYNKTREFYCDYLGCQIDFEHTFADNMPIYMQVSRGNFVLHLSEHHGDATPGACIYVSCEGVDELHAELQAKNYKYLNPGVENMPWGHKVLELTDPFGNKLRFAEPIGKE